MDLLFLRKLGSRAVVALLGLTACMGTMQAANLLTANPTSVTINCSGGTATANVVIKPVTTLTGSNTIVVSTATPPTGVSVTPPSNQTLSTSTQTAGLTYVVGSSGGGCAGLSPTATLTFKAGGNNDVTVTVNFTNTGLQLSPSAATINVVCDPLGTNSVGGTVVIKPVMTLTTSTIAVGVSGATTPIQVTAPSSVTLSSTNQTAGLTYTVGFVSGSGCSNLPATQTLIFTAAGVADVHVTVNIALYGVSISPASLTLSCTNSSGSYSPGPAQTVTVTGNGSNFPFTVSAPSWAHLSSSSGTATSSGVTFTVVAANSCNSLSGGQSVTGNVNITVTGQSAMNKTIQTTLNVVSPSILSASPANPTLTYIKGSGNAGKVAVTITSNPATPAPYFSVKNLPAWLTVDSIGGNTPKTVNFSSTTIADTLAPGTYTASITLSVAGYVDTPLSISLLITNKAPTLSISGGSPVSKQWIQGTPFPTVTLTAVSTDTPIPFTVTTGGQLGPVVAQNSGLAYNFGTSIPVTFSPTAFSSAQPGSTLSGTVSIVWGQPASTTVVTINIVVLSANASLTAVTPSGLPTASAGTNFPLSFTGIGFVPGTDPTVRTKLGIVPSGGNSLVFDSYIITTVTANSITATITVPPTSVNDQYLAPFVSGGTITFGVCNPIPPTNTCSAPTGQTVTLTVSSGPIIQAVTSSSSFIQATPPNNPSVAPYDMISIFGANFCTTCSSSTVIFGSPDANLRYPTSVSQQGDTNSVSVSFYPHAAQPTSGNLIANAPILFATNTQINAIVPSGVAGQSGGVDAYVNWGPSATPSVSSAFPLNVVIADPGIFTIGQDGQGSGAILDSNYKVVGSTNPAGLRKTATNSDVVALYMTGLGAPDSTADNSIAGTVSGAAWPTDCVAASTGSGITTFLQSLEALSGLSNITLDGAIIQASLLNTNRYQPCFVTNDISVKIGGVGPLTIKFAGWVASTVAGLYQVNVQMPSSTASLLDVNGNAITNFTAPVQLPVVVTVGSGGSAPVSQSGVTIWSAPRLLVSAPSQPYNSTANQFVGTVGQAWGMVNGSNTCSTASNCEVAASDSTSSSPSYTYAISSGALPVGLSFNATNGLISGTPAANSAGTYNVTITATDSSVTPALTGSTTMQIVIAGGLYMTANPSTSTINGTSGTAVSNVVTVTPSGGAAPYTYALVSTASGTPALPTSVAVSTSGRVSMTAQMPAGTYPVAVTATDSNGLTGSYGFNLNVALNMTNTTVNNTIAGGSAGTIATVTTTGQTGAITYSVAAVDSNGNAINWVAIDPSSGILTVTSSSATGNGYVATVTATDSVAASGSSAPATTTLPITFNIQ